MTVLSNTLPKKMIHHFDDKIPSPKDIAKWLAEYIREHGVPPPVTESLAIEIGQGSVEIKEFTVGEQE